MVYRGIGDELEGWHEAVQHSAKEYARGGVTTNTVEAFFALLKRGIVETFHNVSRKHRHGYASEFAFRWNTRKVDDRERIRVANLGAERKRLMHRHL